MERKGDTAVDGRVARLAEAQHGVVARAQLRAVGLGASAIDFRLAAGRLHGVHRGVYAVGHAGLGREGRWLAAVLAYGGGAALSHASAAALWGIRPTRAARIHVTVPTAAGLRQRPGIRLHRSRLLADRDVGRRAGIPVTAPARTLVDLAAMLAPGPLRRAVEQSIVVRLFDLAAVDAALRDRRCCRGAAALAGILAELDDDPALTRSEAEALFLDLCAAYDIEPPSVNAHVAGLEVDFSWPGRAAVVEVDGHRYHSTRAAFERDRARDARLALAGRRVVRFSARQLVREPVTVATVVRGLLER